MGRRRCKLHRWRSSWSWLSVLESGAPLWLQLLLLLIDRAVVQESAAARALLGEIAGEVGARMTSAFAFLRSMTVRATDLAERSRARVGSAAKNRGVLVPVWASVVQAWMKSDTHRVVDKSWLMLMLLQLLRWSKVLLLLLLLLLL